MYLYLGYAASLPIERALYLSSFPSNISSTSLALSKVMFVAKAGCPEPTKVNLHQ